MTDIAEHDAEEKRERDAGEDGRVELLVARHTVKIHHFLERSREIVQPEVSR